MATATPQTPPTSRPVMKLDEAQVRVRHPLQKLRGTIRTYVGLEGLTTLLLFLSIWFWVGLVLDYGFFKAFTIDWVQIDTHGVLRAIVLIGCLAGLAALLIVRVGLRLFRDFRDSALALVLERRYPKLLGDRLITAVELANPRMAARYGYSAEMIEQTIQEAAARVDQAPVHEVFDWSRLVWRGVLVGVVSLGLYLVVGLGFCVVGWVQGKSVTGTAGFGRLNEVSGLWAERNLLLRNTIWPRRAFMELIGFPGTEMKMGRDDPAPSLHVRAYKWVAADSTTDEGWRPLRIHEADVAKLLRVPGFNFSLVPAWTPRDRNQGLTLDEVDAQMEKPEVVASLTEEQITALRGLLEAAEAQAANPGMRRTFRKLEIPDMVDVTYKGATTKSTLKLTRQEGNEYTGQFNDLKETVTFTVRGLDYYTPERKIIVVPPPALEEMNTDLYVPAYRYFRTPTSGGVEDLKGKKLAIRHQGVAIQGGDKSTIVVPSGTDVEIEARTDKTLDGPPALLPAAPGAAAVPLEQQAKLDPDGRTFHVRFDNVRQTLYFAVRLRDTDGVVAQRKIEIAPVADKAPNVDLTVDVLRRVPQGYLITPEAMIPFIGKVTDDVALDQVEFVYLLTKIDKQTEQHNRALQMLSVALQMPGGPGQELANIASVASVAREKDKPVEPEPAAKETQHRPVLGFDEKLLNRQGERLPRDILEKKLAEGMNSAPQVSLLKDFLLESTDEKTMFDLKNPKHMPTPLKVEGERAIQPEYRMQLWVEAVDNDIESGPHHSSAKERMPFYIVSEEKLILEIGKEEDQLYAKLRDVLDSLATGTEKLNTLFSDISGDSAKLHYENLAGRAYELGQLLDKSQTPVNEVKTDYDRILRELKINRVNPNMIRKYEVEICGNLGEAKDRDCPAAQKSMGNLAAAFDAKNIDDARKVFDQTRADYKAYYDRLYLALNSMQQMNDYKRILEMIRNIDIAEARQLEELEKARKRAEDDFLNKLGGGK
jgi:hypothetical protein